MSDPIYIISDSGPKHSWDIEIHERWSKKKELCLLLTQNKEGEGEPGAISLNEDDAVTLMQCLQEWLGKDHTYAEI